MGTTELDIPASKHTVSVSIIDSTAYLNVGARHFFQPSFPGHEMLRACCFSFLIEHGDGESKRRLVFDLAVRSDWATGYSPALQNVIQNVLLVPNSTGEMGMISVEKDVYDVLKDHDVDPSSVEAIIWSHTHVDHIGNPSLFGPDTALVVGPGLNTSVCGCLGQAHADGSTGSSLHIFPGYPDDPQSVLLKSDYDGRTLREVTEDDFAKSGITIAGLKAFDYFGDGSFYLLSTPGHSMGHICGLARVKTNSSGTSDPDSFILMAGDAFHHAAELRPSPAVPLPEKLPEAIRDVVPGGSASLLPLLLQPGDPTASFYVPAGTKGKSAHFDPQEALKTIRKLQVLDGHENVLVVAAHDLHLMNLLKKENGLFPTKANDFVARGWVQRSRWLFLADLAVAAKEHQK